MSERFAPTYLTKDQFVAVLEDMRDKVLANDSFEGSLSYELPWSTELGDPVDDSRSGFRVRASYRTGNSMGQGGMRMIGEWVPDE